MNLRKNPRGLMIVDAIIGMFLLTIVFGVVISTMVMGIQSGRQSREFQYAGLAAHGGSGTRSWCRLSLRIQR